MGDTVRYFQPTLHHGDYETILAHVRIPPQRFDGVVDLARFTVQYEDMYGNPRQSGPHVIQAHFVNAEQPVTGFTDGKILESGTMLHFANALKRVGELYYSYKSRENLERALEITMNTKKEILNTRMRLDCQGFVEEIGVLDNYIDALGNELYTSEYDPKGMEKEKLENMYRRGEIAPPMPDRPLENNLRNLCREIVLDLQRKRGDTVAVCDFSSQGSGSGGLPTLVTEMIFGEISQINTLTLVEQERLGSALQDRGLSAADLADKLRAVELGRLLAADYIMTGTVIETENTYIIFSRLLSVKSGEVESSAQVIVPRG
jgi:hypothetical protein